MVFWTSWWLNYEIGTSTCLVLIVDWHKKILKLNTVLWFEADTWVCYFSGLKRKRFGIILLMQIISALLLCHKEWISLTLFHKWLWLSIIWHHILMMVYSLLLSSRRTIGFYQIKRLYLLVDWIHRYLVNIISFSFYWHLLFRPIHMLNMVSEIRC